MNDKVWGGVLQLLRENRFCRPYVKIVIHLADKVQLLQLFAVVAVERICDSYHRLRTEMHASGHTGGSIKIKRVN